MPLKPQAALDKDKLGARYPATLQHRHFAVIAGILADLDGVKLSINPEQRRAIREHFADSLRATNPNFDRARFLAACEVNGL